MISLKTEKQTEKIPRSTIIRSEMIKKERILKEMLPVQGQEMRKLFKEIESEVNRLSAEYVKVLKQEKVGTNQQLN